MRARASRVLAVLLGLAVAVSVVHYADNYWNYADYPVPEPDGLPAPSAAVVGGAWFVFTLLAVLAVLAWRARRTTLAAVLLTAYSVSGLIGVAHYSVPGALDMPWWRQAHVLTDIACGVAVLAFALWAAFRARDLEAEPARTGA